MGSRNTCRAIPANDVLITSLDNVTGFVTLGAFLARSQGTAYFPLAEDDFREWEVCERPTFATQSAC